MFSTRASKAIRLQIDALNKVKYYGTNALDLAIHYLVFSLFSNHLLPLLVKYFGTGY